MDILDIFLDILLKPPQPLRGLFLYTAGQVHKISAEIGVAAQTYQ